MFLLEFSAESEIPTCAQYWRHPRYLASWDDYPKWLVAYVNQKCWVSQERCNVMPKCKISADMIVNPSLYWGVVASVLFYALSQKYLSTDVDVNKTQFSCKTFHSLYLQFTKTTLRNGTADRGVLDIETAIPLHSFTVRARPCDNGITLGTQFKDLFWFIKSLPRFRTLGSVCFRTVYDAIWSFGELTQSLIFRQFADRPVRLI